MFGWQGPAVAIFLALFFCVGGPLAVMHMERTHAEPSYEERVRAWNEKRARERAAFRKDVELCREWCAPYGWSYGEPGHRGAQGCVCSARRD